MGEYLLAAGSDVGRWCPPGEEGFLGSQVPADPPSGVKLDDGKLPMHLLPPEAIDALAERLQVGMRKYQERNWEKGIVFSRLFSATMRHLLAFWRGEDIDKDDGLCHLSGVLINVAFMISFTRRGRTDLDDRPVKGL